MTVTDFWNCYASNMFQMSWYMDNKSMGKLKSAPKKPDRAFQRKILFIDVRWQYHDWVWKDILKRLSPMQGWGDSSTSIKHNCRACVMTQAQQHFGWLLEVNCLFYF